MGGPPTGRARLRADSGFTLVEAVVALMVLAIIFTALAMAAMGAVRASWAARVEQQGVDFATQALERARQMDFGALAHVSADLSGDPRISACGVDTCIDPGTGTPERLIVDSAGGVNPHITAVPTAQSNNVAVTLATYVTDPGDTEAAYKRVTVIASWALGGVQRQRVISGMVTETTRGLPLPIFKLTPLGNTSVAVNPGADAVLGFELSNQGAPDRWNLTFAGAASTSWTVYRDDGDRIWEGSTSDVELTNTNAPADTDGDTGRIDPTGSVVFWAVRTVSNSTVAGDYWSSITATSAAQPTAPTAVASVDLLVRVVDGAVTGDPGGGQLNTTPGAPTNLQLTTGDGILGASWTPPASAGSSPITDYVVSYKLAGSPTWTVFPDGVSTTTTATITGLTNGSTYDVSVAAENAIGIGAQAATAQGQPVAPITYTAPILCPASSPAPTGSANNGYTLRAYALHNRSAANPSWPGVGVPQATSTLGQGLPLIAAVDGAQVPAGTNLPVYSSDLASAEPGRVLLGGGSLGTADTTRVVDWRSTAGSKAYKGTAVVRLWVAPVTGDDATLPWSITAQPYVRNADATLSSLSSAVTVTGAANSFGPSGCLGWQEVWMTFSVNQSSALKSNEYIGVRVWNPAGSGRMARLRVAYDVVGDFPATFTVPEKP